MAKSYENMSDYTVTTNYTSATQTVSINLLESGPIFVNLADQIAFTTFSFVVFLLVYSMNGIFISTVAFNVQLHTPYFALLIINAIHDLIMSATTFLSVIYMSLSGTNPYRGNRAMCFVHRMFQMMPFLSKIHSAIFLSLERLLFFYRPFWYLRVVTIPRVIVIEVILFTLSSIFSSLTTAVGEIYFSPAMLLCSNLTKSWVWASQMSLYYVPNILVLASTIASLYHLVLKQRRAISSVAVTASTTSATSREEQQTAEVDRQTSPANVTESSVRKIRATIKLVAGISGIFWISIFPALIGMNIMLSKNLILEAELASNVKARLSLRFINFSPIWSWIADPLIYYFVNPQLKHYFYQMLRK